MIRYSFDCFQSFKNTKAILRSACGSVCWPLSFDTAYLTPPHYELPLPLADLADQHSAFLLGQNLYTLTLWAMPSLSWPLPEPPPDQDTILPFVFGGWQAHLIHYSFSNRKASQKAAKYCDSSWRKHTCTLSGQATAYPMEWHAWRPG